MELASTMTADMTHSMKVVDACADAWVEVNGHMPMSDEFRQRVTEVAVMLVQLRPEDA